MTTLGIDYGLRKVGLAVLDEKVGISQPIGVIQPQQINDWLVRYKKKYLINKVIIGFPGNKLNQTVEKLGETIANQHSLSVIFIDETLSTQDAQNSLRNVNAKRKKVKKLEDAIAAALMLQSYVERGKYD